MAQFKDLLGWDDKQGNVEFGPPGSIRTSAPDPMAPRNPDDGDGPSYRRLPETVRPYYSMKPYGGVFFVLFPIT